jgi:hypothetical protein
MSPAIPSISSYSNEIAKLLQSSAQQLLLTPPPSHPQQHHDAIIFVTSTEPHTSYEHRTILHSNFIEPLHPSARRMNCRSLVNIKKSLPWYHALMRRKVYGTAQDGGIWGLGSTMSSAPRSTSTFVDGNKSIFPWRHDSSLPERVLERNDLSGPSNPTARDRHKHRFHQQRWP